MTGRPIRRLAIVNRGEPAMRAIHAVRELNASRDEPITVIALYTEPDREALFVRRADEARLIGPAKAYLDEQALERALVESRADAAWAGWGFVSERPTFVELCDRLGVAFLGPSAEVMRRLGDKIGAKLLAEQAGVPVAPWSGGPVADAQEALRHAGAIGFPLMIKASAGGGGRGIRRVERSEDLPAAFQSARAEAVDAVGDGTVLLERVIAPARHIEVQVIADGRGGAWAAGVRDCSLQRRNQKVIEESSSTALDAEQERVAADAALRLVRHVGYRGAATVEFLYEPESRLLSFMEVNTRLQVEHPVTEAVTGLDLVKLQIHVAEGGTLDGAPPPAKGHAIEARLNAEDPALGFAPAPGRIKLLRLPTGPGLRVDTGVAEGDVIPADFDSMIAKIIAWGADRAEALARLRRAVAETLVVIDGGTTNQGFLLELLDQPELRTGAVDTGWLDRRGLRGDAEPPRHGEVAVLQAAIEMAGEAVAADRARFYAYARRGRPQADASTRHIAEVRHRGERYRLEVSEVAPSRYRITVDGVTTEMGVTRLNDYERRVDIGGRSYGVVVAAHAADLMVEVDGVPHRVGRDDGGLVRNLAPAIVVSIPVAVDDIVEHGDVIAVVESMKMESSLTAPFRGRVREVLVSPNVQVSAHAPLLRLEPLEARAEERSSGRLPFPPVGDPAASGAPGRCHANLERLEWLVLGYDIEDAEVRRVVEDLHGECRDVLACDPALVPGEHRVLELYADLRALTRPRHDAEDGLLETEPARSDEEYLHAWLRSLDAEGEGLPPSFADKLRRALRHYGVESLDRTPALEEACYRLFLAEHRAASARSAVVAILDRRLDQAEDLVGNVGSGFRDALDHVMAAAEGRDAIVSDLARQNRWRYYDEPVLEEARTRVYADVEVHLAALADAPDAPGAGEHLQALVAVPQPLAPMLTRRLSAASHGLRRVLLETMTRRYYRQHDLAPFEETDGFLTTEYEGHDARVHLAAGFVELGDVGRATRELAAWATGLPEDAAMVADLYAEHRGAAPSPEELAATLREQLAGVEMPPAVRRIVVAVAEPARGLGMAAVDTFTFRMRDGTFAEDLVLRGLHPMMADRLNLWRLREFELSRLPSAEDVYAFHGTARENRQDERLFVLAEVRDLTSVREEDGSIRGLPDLERMLVESLESIRAFQAHRKLSRRLQWNRVILYCWPRIELAPEEIRAVVNRLAPLTAGLGIEMLFVLGRTPEGERVLRFFTPTGRDVVVEVDPPPIEPLRPLDEGARRVIAARRRGTLHPAEIVKLLAPAHSDGEFVEHDLDDDGRLVPVDRPAATNSASIVAGLIRNRTERHPEGMLRVALLGDPTRALGSLAEPECRRIMAGLDLAEELGVPVEWFALSAGAKIAMDSGTENMDWIAAVLRRIIEFTQRGGELNVVVTGINVGAQPYWNAEATMLMHTKGILVMTPESAMVLTGKQSLDYSGGVSAEDNFGIGGYERIMGPNGQAQYWAGGLPEACRILLAHYEHTYVAPGERFPRRAATSDPVDRDVRSAPHFAPGSDLATVGDIFSDASNPGRKKPFDIRSVMRAAIDADHPPLERWAAMRDAETAVVWDAHLGGRPVALLGIESRPLPRYGPLPADGPQQYTSGTLFPRSSKKIARAVNAASGVRPLVVLANLAGFDGSPESMREWQLEFGAEIGRAVVNFDGPIVFCVVSRYHGGAFVVFSQKLNENLETVALEGAHASVIGGAAAAGVVFAREADRLAAADERIASLDAAIEAASGAERSRLRAQRDGLWPSVRSAKVGELAARFDAVHDVERAVRMGSVSGIIPPERLRPYLVDAVERGVRRVEARGSGDGRHPMAERAAR